MPKKAPTLPATKKANRRVAEQTKEKIKAVKLVNRLQQFALANPIRDDEGNLIGFQDDKGQYVPELTREQLTASMKLLDKIIPNITKSEHEETVTHKYEASQEVTKAIQALTKQANEKIIEGETIDALHIEQDCKV